MKRFLRPLLRAVIPESLWKRLHYFRKHQDYLILLPETLEYAEDNLFTFNAAPFLKDQRFERAYSAGVQTNSWHGLAIRWRAYVACWAGEHASRLDGDFVECGVNRGGLARAIIEYINFGECPKRFFLVDTFSGLVPEYLNEAEVAKNMLELFAYYKDNSRAAVEEIFRPFPNVKVIQGAVPDVLPELPLDRVAYLSLDMNCTLPEIRAAEFFWDRMVPGGVILLDDYTQKLHSEQQIAFDQFARKRGVGILALPTGQGLLIKS